MSLKWSGEKKQFSSDWEGLNNAGIHTFIGADAINAYVREMFQNSIDQADKTTEKPVCIRIRKTLVEGDDFPFRDDWKHVLLQIEKGNSGHKHFFDKIREETMGFSKIPLLIYEESNTYGLKGEDGETEGSFNALVRSQGKHVGSNSSGGSYGIGKNAIFGLSYARTVLFASFNKQSGYVFQGVSILASYIRGNQTYGGKIYCGVDDDQTSSVRDESVTRSYCNGALSRSGKPGLTQIAVCPKLNRNWSSVMTKAVLRNYWHRIQEGRLEVIILNESNDEETIINRETLEEQLIYNYEGSDIKSSDGGNPLNYYRCFNEGQRIVGNVKGLGEVEFKFFLNDGDHPDGVAYLRNGMVIKANTRDTHGFSSLPFTGLIHCLEQAGNDVLRLMEPPTHDDFIPEIYREQKGADLATGRAIVKGLKTLIRKGLQTLMDEISKETDSIPWLDDFMNSVLSTVETGDLLRTNELSKKETPRLRVGTLPKMSLNFHSESQNKFSKSSEDGVESAGSGGNDGGAGGRMFPGPGPKTKGKNNQGSGALEGGKSKKTELEQRIFRVSQAQNDSWYYRAVVGNAKTGGGSDERVDLTLTQRGDSGVVSSSKLLSVYDADKKVELVFDSVRSNGEVTGFIIRNVALPSTLRLEVNEPYKSNFIFLSA